MVTRDPSLSELTRMRSPRSPPPLALLLRSPLVPRLPLLSRGCLGNCDDDDDADQFLLPDPDDDEPNFLGWGIRDEPDDLELADDV